MCAWADADGKAPASARKSKGGAGGYEMAPELRKVVDAMRAAVAELPPPPEDDRKQGLPQVIKDLLPALAGHLTRCTSVRTAFVLNAHANLRTALPSALDTLAHGF